jgi:hypothetical protein
MRGILTLPQKEFLAVSRRNSGMRISREFVIAVKLHQLPAYKLAQLARVNPNTLSKILNHAEPVREFDERVLAVASVLNLPAESCFEPDRQNESGAPATAEVRA